MACMPLVSGFMPKSTLVLRMASARLCLQRKTLILVVNLPIARRGAEVSHGGGGKINQTRKSMDAVRMAEEKLSLGGFNSVKENKKQSKEKVDDGITVNTETSG
ncbi:hypothetical protein H0E87_020954 [Populus deltoides]|uniref:Uncharacterized protein n=1 Tax=Populus deltoides TaxID=3696 RepID=A0A8T2XLG1_POPDE|nr:hypothetical protein H0E87_020954 [Populus deltoides]